MMHQHQPNAHTRAIGNTHLPVRVVLVAITALHLLAVPAVVTAISETEGAISGNATTRAALVVDGQGNVLLRAPDGGNVLLNHVDVVQTITSLQATVAEQQRQLTSLTQALCDQKGLSLRRRLEPGRFDETRSTLFTLEGNVYLITVSASSPLSYIYNLTDPGAVSSLGSLEPINTILHEGPSAARWTFYNPPNGQPFLVRPKSLAQNVVYLLGQPLQGSSGFQIDPTSYPGMEPSSSAVDAVVLPHADAVELPFVVFARVDRVAALVYSIGASLQTLPVMSLIQRMEATTLGGDPTLVVATIDAVYLFASESGAQDLAQRPPLDIGGNITSIAHTPHTTDAGDEGIFLIATKSGRYSELLFVTKASYREHQRLPAASSASFATIDGVLSLLLAVPIAGHSIGDVPDLKLSLYAYSTSQRMFVEVESVVDTAPARSTWAYFSVNARHYLLLDKAAEYSEQPPSTVLQRFFPQCLHAALDQ
ncbi:hypothetical protein PTSG_06776 [Salpingoeca rosetta]|uniref:Uncharacterized protein n=1 Tax=Salpingoeca rosetta (strain ATCC 50818 / BSB-021) TaxID=946362 RepID=F2UES1_SALR5|nr:uncharacterized protein PTSG_06776 [Salpingoeca rosetta]EGD75121.1 hypothetical protein PTSG_06776 [Salpingoeca rosetta]|eukprot:XP_004992174.1 hypothetical protein PTSG_06776 [Salpingoeca rosetta]